MQDILYLGSQSRPRQRLLEEACIPFKVLLHGSDEVIDHTLMTFTDHVLAVAQSKIRALQLPTRTEVGKDYMFVVTADTLVRTLDTKVILGKPVNKEHAISMLQNERRGPVEVVTACCLEKFTDRDGIWISTEAEHWVQKTTVEFYVDEESIDLYFQKTSALLCSGAGFLEGHGSSYLKSINGSYTAAIGLPLYELRQALKKLKFKF